MGGSKYFFVGDFSPSILVGKFFLSILVGKFFLSIWIRIFSKYRIFLVVKIS